MTVPESEKLKALYTATTTKLTENLSAEKNRNKELAGRIKELEDIVEDYKKGSKTNVIIRTSDKEKKVAELYASGLASGFIYKTMLEQLHMDMSLNEIEKIVSNLEGDGRLIPVDLVQHYLTAKKTFTEKNTIDKGFFATSLHKKFKLLEEEYTISLMRAKNDEDEESKRKILDALVKLYQVEASAFSKNTLAIFGKQSADNVTKDYDEETKELFGDDNRNIIKFQRKA